MPVEILTDGQAERHGRFVEMPSRSELDRLCFLDDADRRLVAGPGHAMVDLCVCE
jgi:hypothetical protein